MSMGKRPRANADEYTVFSHWRRVCCWTQRPGATDAVKRRARRRERQVAKRTLRGAGNED